jgi:hypothetical protein
MSLLRPFSFHHYLINAFGSKFRLVGTPIDKKKVTVGGEQPINKKFDIFLL